MTEQELLEKIKKSAGQLDIPDGISPEAMAEKLNSQNKTPKQGSRHIHFLSARRAVSAAAVLLLCFMLAQIAQNANRIAPQINLVASGTNEAARESSESDAPAQAAGETDMPKHDAGSLYTVAKSYDQVYKQLSSYGSRFLYDTEEIMAFNTDGAEAAPRDLAVAEKAKAETAAADTGTGRQDFSKTNLQTEGVDESDIVKTDGRYIYTVRERKIIITDTAGNTLTPAGTIAPELAASDSILELYVDNGILLLTVQRYSFDDTISADSPTEGMDARKMADTASSGDLTSVAFYVYDIANPAAPKLTGTSTQDGYYKTSRKIGDLFYLFTENQDLAYEAAQNETLDGIMPRVNGKKVPYDHIYLPESGGGSLLLSSFDLKNPGESVDEIMVVHDYAEVYVGNSSIYLYGQTYQTNGTLTRIAKFSMDGGQLDAVNAATVKGSINDSFAINEYKDSLRVLATSYDSRGVSSNHLFVFDEKLKLTGSLSDLARGEIIYAARYFGDTAYFITYRNTDPLFAVDISDRANPRLLGELKITGFSEYLHFWGDGRLLGIGYETDPDTGRTEGLKLVMFDISNPAELKTVDSLVLNDYSYSSALYDYKSVLADPAKNLIGFSADHYANEESDESYSDYAVYTWENDRFAAKMTRRLPNYSYGDSTRGLYIGSTFYLADLTSLTGFDMTQDFKEISQLTLE